MRYRVWNEAERTMTYPDDEDNPYLLAPDGMVMRKCVESEGGAYFVETRDCTALDSTNYRDGNRKEIYAGDLMITDWLETVKGVPVNVKSRRTVEQITDSRSISQMIGDLQRWRIIGNVYENPRLLEAVEKCGTT